MTRFFPSHASVNPRRTKDSSSPHLCRIQIPKRSVAFEKGKRYDFAGRPTCFLAFDEKNRPSTRPRSFLSENPSEGKVEMERLEEREREREGEAGCKREQATARVCERERERERDREGKRERGRGREREGRELESVSSGWSNYPTVSRSGAARAAW